VRAFGGGGKFVVAGKGDVETRLLRTERCSLCAGLFMICRACYRGQTHCNAACREQRRKVQTRTAHARHQQSAEGRADHRDRNRECRLRKRSAALASVMDHGSQKVAPTAKISLPASPTESIPDASAVDGRDSHDNAVTTPGNHLDPATTFRCVVCHRIGVVVSQWPTRRASRKRQGPRRFASSNTT
jgi:hypothetical protein